MVYPVFSDLLVGRGKGQSVLYHRVSKEGGVKVDTHISFLGKFDPFSEMRRLDLISAYRLTLVKDRERTEEAHAEESACRRRDWRRPRVARLARAPERGGGRAGGAGLTRERESEKCKER